MKSHFPFLLFINSSYPNFTYMYHSECKSCKDHSPDGLCSSPVLSAPGHQVESVLGKKPSIFNSGSGERRTYCFSIWSFSICRLLCQQTVSWVLSSMLFMFQHSESGWCLAVGRRVLKHRSQSSLLLLREQVSSTNYCVFWYGAN